MSSSIRMRLLWGIGLAVLVALTAGCTGRGGGWLPPEPAMGFADQATLGFTFKCERSSRSTNARPPTGRLHIQLAYAEHGNGLLGGPFGVHGVADRLDPVLESAVCIGQEPPPGGKELIFLGRYRFTSHAPPGAPQHCLRAGAGNAPWCRFEVIVRDHDLDRAPSAGDYFSIALSSSTTVPSSDDAATTLPDGSVFYSRAGYLGGGEIHVR